MSLDFLYIDFHNYALPKLLFISIIYFLLYGKVITFFSDKLEFKNMDNKSQLIFNPVVTFLSIFTLFLGWNLFVSIVIGVLMIFVALLRTKQSYLAKKDRNEAFQDKS